MAEPQGRQAVAQRQGVSEARGDSDALPVPAQSIPVPEFLSPEAQAFLAAAHRRIAVMQAAGAPAPAPGGRDEMESILEMLRIAAARFHGAADTIDLADGAKLYRFRPDARRGRPTIAYFDIHGGGFATGGGEMCRLLAQARAADFGVEVYAVDYRLLPDHPFPAGLDDCMAAWREILAHHKASDLVVGGASAGGNLAAAMLLRGRDEGLPLPAALVLLTPALDMLGAGDSHHTNRFLDVNLYGAGNAVAAYAKAGDPLHPYLSPIFGDYTKGWPPTLLASGTRDLLLSDAVRMHRILRRAGIRAELHVTEAGGHGGFQGRAPEDRELLAECRRFMDEAWGIED